MEKEKKEKENPQKINSWKTSTDQQNLKNNSWWKKILTPSTINLSRWNKKWIITNHNQIHRNIVRLANLTWWKKCKKTSIRRESTWFYKITLKVLINKLTKVLIFNQKLYRLSTHTATKNQERQLYMIRAFSRTYLKKKSSRLNPAIKASWIP